MVEFDPKTIEKEGDEQPLDSKLPTSPWDDESVFAPIEPETGTSYSQPEIEEALQ